MNEESNCRTVYRVSDLLELVSKLKKFNSIPLENLDFVDEDGKFIKVDEDEVRRWRLIGLSNMYYVLEKFDNESEDEVKR